VTRAASAASERNATRRRAGEPADVRRLAVLAAVRRPWHTRPRNLTVSPASRIAEAHRGVPAPFVAPGNSGCGPDVNRACTNRCDRSFRAQSNADRARSCNTRGPQEAYLATHASAQLRDFTQDQTLSRHRRRHAVASSPTAVQCGKNCPTPRESNRNIGARSAPRTMPPA
jgi:hypothetical protein